MQILNEPLESSVIQFGDSPRRRTIALALLLSGLAGMAVTAWVARGNPAWHSAGLTIFLLVFQTGAVILIRRARLEIDVENHVVRRVRGVWVFAREKVFAIDPMDRLLLSHAATPTLYGAYEERATLLLDTGGRPFTLLRSQPVESARTLAQALARRLCLELEETEFIPRPVAALKAVPVVLWLSVIAVAGCVAWSFARSPGAGPMPAWMAATHPTEMHYQGGIAAYWSQDYKQSEIEFRLAINHDPRSSDSYNMLAYALVEQHRMDDALKAAMNALALAPNDGNILDTVAEMHQRRREWESAARYYELALARQRPWPIAETRVKYAQTLLALNRTSDAISQLEGAAPVVDGPWGARARQFLQDLRALPAMASIPTDPAVFGTARGGPQPARLPGHGVN